MSKTAKEWAAHAFRFDVPPEWPVLEKHFAEAMAQARAEAIEECAVEVESWIEIFGRCEVDAEARAWTALALAAEIRELTKERP